MFERYTEKARRVIFFARYEASQCGAHHIGTPSLLLGILRENTELMDRLLPADEDLVRLRADVEALLPKPGQDIKTSVDLPLSGAAKSALLSAARESQRLQHKFIDPRHLLFGLLTEGGPETACLRPRGITVEGVRGDLQRAAPETAFDFREGPDPELNENCRRTELLRAFTELPADRLQAGITLLKALASDKFEVTGTGPDGPFHFSFGGETQ
jgi:ATP-dependent Clp protease ATP-binding subunit ClpC